MTAEVWARYSYGCSDTIRAHLLSSWGSISFGMPFMLPSSNSKGIKLKVIYHAHQGQPGHGGRSEVQLLPNGIKIGTQSNRCGR